MHLLLLDLITVICYYLVCHKTLLKDFNMYRTLLLIYCHSLRRLNILLHWLPVAVRIEFKTLVLVFKAYHGILPLYISDVITKYEPTRSLCSSSKRLLLVPWYNFKTYGRRAFSVNGPMLWNSLPNNSREIESLSTFKKLIKTFLFKHSF